LIFKFSRFLFFHFNEPNSLDDFNTRNEDTATTTLEQLLSIYKLRPSKDECFLVVRSQPKFSGSILSADVPLSMALRELKDLKKYNYKVCIKTLISRL
jgi:hypothetical protein